MGRSQAEFFDEIEDVLYRLLRGGGDIGACQDVLMALRLHVLAVAPEDAPLRSRIEELFQEAFLIASHLTTISQAKRRDDLRQTMRQLGQATAALLAASDFAGLSEAAAKHLPTLGIESGAIALFTEPDRVTEELELLTAFNDRGLRSLTNRYTTAMLLPDEVLSNRSMVVLPLAFRGEKLGIVALEYGPPLGLLYEELRQAIAAAVKRGLLAREVAVAKAEVEKLAVTDALTGLYNRRHLMTRVHEEFVRSARTKRAMSALMIDLDGFKRVNDQLGHDAGDEVLKCVSNILQGGIREIDVAARLGGDEFVLLLPETGALGAMNVAQRLVDQIAAQPEAKMRGSSASFGAATFDPSQDQFDEKMLVHLADRALLEAKRQGKNRAIHIRDVPNEAAKEASAAD
jgi:diguanylate cyclase (GGDEF)-like protein